MPTKNKLDKLKALLELANEDYASNAEVARLFKALVQTVKDTQAGLDQKLAQHTDKMEASFSSLSDTLKDTETRLEQIIAKRERHTLQELKDVTQQLREEIKGVQSLIPEIPSPTDLSPLEGKLTEIEARLIHPDFVENVQDTLEALDGDVVSLKEEVENLKSEPKQTTRVLAGPNANAIQYADLTAQCDGATKSFEVPRHRFALSLQSTQFPIIYRPVIDFTTADKTLTMTDEVAAPETGQTLIFIYVK